MVMAYGVYLNATVNLINFGSKLKFLAVKFWELMNEQTILSVGLYLDVHLH